MKMQTAGAPSDSLLLCKSESSLSSSKSRKWARQVELEKNRNRISHFRRVISDYAFCTPASVLRQAEAFEACALNDEALIASLLKDLAMSYSLMDMKITFVDALLKLGVSVITHEAASKLLTHRAAPHDFYVLHFSFFDFPKHKLLRADAHRVLFLKVAEQIRQSNNAKLPTLIAVDQDMTPTSVKPRPTHAIQRIKDGKCVCPNLLRLSEQLALVNNFRVPTRAPPAIAKAPSLFPDGLGRHMACSSSPADSYHHINAHGYLNILVLGRSGIGKTTFIKSACNYLSFETLTEAAAYHANVLDSEGNFDLTKEVNTQEYEETTLTTSYTVRSARGRVRFVDTPGEGGDTFDAMQRYLWTNLDEVQGVCVLMDPNEMPLNEMTCSFLERALDLFPPENIVLVFTRARSSLYEVGLSLFGLEKLVKINKWSFNLSAQTMYCIDNESLQYLARHRCKSAEFGFDEVDRMAESWDRSHKVTWSLLQYLMLLRPCVLSPPALCLHLRKEVLRLTEPIARLGQCLAVSLRLLDGLRGREEASAFELRVRLAPRVFCPKSTAVKTVTFADGLEIRVIEPAQHPRAGGTRRMSTVIPDEICLQCDGLADSHKHLTAEYSQAQVPLSQLLEGVEPAQLEAMWEEQVAADLNKLLSLAVALTYSLRTAPDQTRGYDPVDQYLSLWAQRCVGRKFFHVRESIAMVRELYTRKIMTVAQPPDPYALIQTLHRWPRYAQIFHQVSAADPADFPVWLI